jgi:hypothetical protein
MGVGRAETESPTIAQDNDPARGQIVGAIEVSKSAGPSFSPPAEFGQKLIIEVDGSQHGFAKGEASDRIRDAHFSEAGFSVLRFWNNEVDRNMDGVIDTVLAALPPSGSLRSPPSPQGGKD